MCWRIAAARRFFLPVLVAYQAWSYYVFRTRIGRAHIPPEVPVLEAPMRPGAAAASRGGRPFGRE